MILKAHQLLHRLERSKTFWVLFICLLLFFVLRLPSLFEPYWYGDEGIYEVLGDAVRHGQILYSQIWDNKPPLLYITYAIVSGDQFFAKLLSLFAGLGAITSLFFLSKKLFKHLLPTAVSTIVFTILFGLPFFEGNIANAENFMLFPIILSALTIYTVATKTQKAKPLLIAGLLLGIAFLYKIVAIFDLGAFSLFLLFALLPDSFSFQTIKKYILSIWKPMLMVFLGFTIPFLLSLIYFGLNNALSDYFQAIFFSTAGYVGYGNTFIIPQGLLIAKLLLLAICSLILLLKRKSIPEYVLFILIWTSFSLFNAFFSQRPYTHYLLVLVPSFSLLVGWVFIHKHTVQKAAVILSILVGVTGLYFFNHWSVTKTTGYYTNFIQFVLGNKTQVAYQNFFDRRTPKDYAVASYINSHKKPGENIYVWGNSAQLYHLTGTLPPSRYTVAYHIGGDKTHILEAAKAIEKASPQFIIMEAGMTMYPFSLYNYEHAITISENDIYERVR